jgi:hypothetical protein
MKRKIGEIYNKPIVEGDKNLVRGGGAEIHINDLQTNNSSSSNVSKYAPKYYSIDWSKASEDWNKMLTVNIEDLSTVFFTIGATYKLHGVDRGIVTYPCISEYPERLVAFSVLPLVYKADLGDIFISNNLKESIITLNDFFKTALGIDINLTMEGITEITEEEFYKVD